MTEKKKRLFQEIIRMIKSGTRRARWGRITLEGCEVKADGYYVMWYDEPRFLIIDHNNQSEWLSDADHACEKFWETVLRRKEVRNGRVRDRELDKSENWILAKRRFQMRQPDDYSPLFV